MNRLPGAAVAVALLLCAASLASAAPAKLVKDIERMSVGCEASDFVSGPGALYFGTGLRCRGGLALWRTDGTEEGTRVVRTFERGPRNLGFVQPIAAIGDQLYFGLSEVETWGSPIVEMWRTDGTESGTTLVWQATGDLRFDHVAKSTSQTEVAFHGKLLFFVADGYLDTSLWVSDGTVAGTHPVRALDGFPVFGQRFLVRDDAVFFVAYGSDHISLWRSDGTTEGTEPVHPLGLNALEAGVPTLASDGTIYFTVNLGTGSNELWRTGGTAETTERLVGLPFRTTWRLVDGVHFILEARRVAVNLWGYDPATNQVAVVKNLDPAPRGENEMFVYGERDGVLLFSNYAFLGSREKLWRSDGTPDGTYVLYDGLLTGDVAEGRDGFVFRPDPLDGSKPLWHTDGTVAGTREIRPASFDGIRSEGIVATSDTTLFVTTTANSLDVLWRTDGTPGGTVAVRSIPFAPTAQGFGVLGARVVFWSSSDLWRSDGTPDGTRKLLPFGTDTASALPRSLTDVDGTLFFDVQRLFARTNELWRSDGTKGGTRLVADFPDGNDELRLLTPGGGRLLFARGLHELWSSDGTPEETKLLADLGSVADGAWIKDLATIGATAFAAIAGNDPLSGALIRVDPAAGSTASLATVPPDSLAPFDGALYFTAPVSPTVEGLWRSDGTSAGTAPVATFHAATSRKRPVITRLFVDADAIFFTVGYQRRLELWRSDGTSDGTTKVTALPLPPGSNGRGGVFEGTFLDGVFLFSYANVDGGDSNLWRSDGTEAGTAPITQAGVGLSLGDMTRLGKRVLFITPIPYLTLPPPELWATDGTESGTVRLLDAAPSSLTVTGDTAFFCASINHSVDEPRLWRTDGTPAGTVPAFDRALSCTGDLEISGGQLFFGALTRRYGAELWAMPLDPP